MSVAQNDSRHLPISWGMRGEGAQAGMFLRARVSVCVRVPMLACIY